MKILKLLILVFILVSCEQERDAELSSKKPPIDLKNEPKDTTDSTDTPETRDSTVTKNILVKKDYYEDARQLYFREIKADPTHANYNKAEFDTVELNTIVSMLEAVYKLDSPESKLVFQTHKIHAKKCYNFNSLVIDLRTLTPEANNLVNGKIPTGDVAIDKILTKYNFNSVKFFRKHLDASMIAIYTKASYNYMPIMEEFKAVPSVIFIYPNGVCFDGDDIILTRKGDKATIVFSKGEGDCPSGCMTRKNWEFTVENKVAKFVRFTQKG